VVRWRIPRAASSSRSEGSWCEVAIAEDGRVRAAGRIATRVDALEVFAQSLVVGDVVALEATSGSDKVVSIFERHGVRVIVANTRKLKSITDAKAKTDRLDARALARLLISGLLDEVWTPDERTRALRRLTSRRERIVRARTRAKNETHGVLSRNLCERPPVTDAFGSAGRRWLASLELPIDERLTLDGCLRQIDFLDGEIGALDREIARLALALARSVAVDDGAGRQRQTAAAFMASVGDIGRFSSPRKLVSYLGLDPRVRQSGNTPARHGRISSRDEDYAFARPAMTRNKIRKLKLLAGAPPQKGRHVIAGGKSQAIFDAERELSRQAEAADRRLVNDWRAAAPPRAGASATPGRASQRPSKGKAARQAR
jgi:transposase